jgi:rSAM/selenodomain-associated transferase 2
MKVSVIIPVLNEIALLPQTIEILEKSKISSEIIAVDGGSEDGTWEWLEAQSAVLAVKSRRGRGVQQNAGAGFATGDVLLFLHADSFLPPDAFEQIAAALSNPLTSGGCFFVRFADKKTFSLEIIERSINLRTEFFLTATGDQAIFVRHKVFKRIGGFSPIPLFEDVKMVAAIKKQGRFAALKSPVTISARRWLKQGVWRTTALIHLLRIGYYLGFSPETLKRLFVDVRSPAEKISETNGGAFTNFG